MLRMKCLQIIFLFYILLKFGNGLEYLKYFMKVPNSALKDSKTLMTLDVDAFNCSKKCFETSGCKSFVSRTISPSCILYEDDTSEKMLIGASNTYFYQLRRSVPTKYRDGRCPVNLIYHVHALLPNLLKSLVGTNYTQCFYRCEAEPNCQSFHYVLLNEICILSAYNHTHTSFHRHNGYIYTDINRKLWNDFKLSNTLEKINSVGCGIRIFDSYYFVDRKEVKDLTAHSTFSFKQNPYHNRVTDAKMDTHSVLDCSRLCMISSTCTAFSYTNTKCLRKKLN